MNSNSKLNNDIKVVGLVILYNPEPNITDNIATFINQIDKLYVVDNSSIENKLLFDGVKCRDKIIYLPNYENLGVARALNIGAQKAIEEGYDYLLTMDQDSYFLNNGIQNLIEKISSLEDVGIISPLHITNDTQQLPEKKQIYEVDTVMTSGNLLNLKAYKKVGGFLEKLFIDYVDNEYCLRLKENRYKVLVDNSVILNHNLGKTKIKKFLFWYLIPTFHLPIRLYYRTRNRLYCIKRYKKKFPKFLKEQRKCIFKETLAMFFYESNKIKKTKMIVKGYSHFRKNKFGKMVN